MVNDYIMIAKNRIKKVENDERYLYMKRFLPGVDRDTFIPIIEEADRCGDTIDEMDLDSEKNMIIVNMIKERDDRLSDEDVYRIFFFLRLYKESIAYVDAFADSFIEQDRMIQNLNNPNVDEFSRKKAERDFKNLILGSKINL